MSGRGQYLYERATTPPSKERKDAALKREAKELRARLDQLVEQLGQDQSSPYAMYLPMLGALMASMDDGALLDLRDLLQAIVGD